MSAALDWRDTDVEIPDVSKRSTLLSMAKMTFNAYYADNSSDWYNVDEDGWDKACVALVFHYLILILTRL